MASRIDRTRGLTAKDADMMPSLERLQEELAGLKWDTAATLQRDVQEGLFHRGISEVVQLAGRKP